MRSIRRTPFRVAYNDCRSTHAWNSSEPTFDEYVGPIPFFVVPRLARDDIGLARALFERLTCSYRDLVRSAHRSACESRTLEHVIRLHSRTTTTTMRRLPRCARSESSKRFAQSFTPRDSFFSISSTNSGRFTTQPLPRTSRVTRRRLVRRLSPHR